MRRNFGHAGDSTPEAAEEKEWMALGMLAFSRLALGGIGMMGDDGWWTSGGLEGLDDVGKLGSLESLEGLKREKNRV